MASDTLELFRLHFGCGMIDVSIGVALISVCNLFRYDVAGQAQTLADGCEELHDLSNNSTELVYGICMRAYLNISSEKCRIYTKTHGGNIPKRYKGHHCSNREPQIETGYDMYRSRCYCEIAQEYPTPYEASACYGKALETMKLDDEVDESDERKRRKVKKWCINQYISDHKKSLASFLSTTIATMTTVPTSAITTTTLATTSPMATTTTTPTTTSITATTTITTSIATTTSTTSPTTTVPITSPTTTLPSTSSTKTRLTTTTGIFTVSSTTAPPPAITSMRIISTTSLATNATRTSTTLVTTTSLSSKTRKPELSLTTSDHPNRSTLILSDGMKERNRRQRKRALHRSTRPDTASSELAIVSLSGAYGANAAIPSHCFACYT